MSHQEPELVKVLFRYHSNVLDEETVETMWAKTINSKKGIYQLDSIPFYGPIIAPNDTFIAKYLDNKQMLTFQEIIEYSGNSVVLVSITNEETDKKTIREKFKSLNCESEGLNDSYFAMEIPQKVNYKIVKSILEEYENNDIFHYAEPCLSDKHNKDLE